MENILEKNVVQNAPGKFYEATLEEIIKDINYQDNYHGEYIRHIWFTKQIEDWKRNNQDSGEPSKEELKQIVKQDLKQKIVNTMLAFKR